MCVENFGIGLCQTVNKIMLRLKRRSQKQRTPQGPLENTRIGFIEYLSKISHVSDFARLRLILIESEGRGAMARAVSRTSNRGLAAEPPDGSRAQLQYNGQ